MKHLPKWIKGALLFNSLGVLLLVLSLFARTPPTYLASIGLGATALTLGVLCFVIFLFSDLKSSPDSSDGNGGSSEELQPDSA